MELIFKGKNLLANIEARIIKVTDIVIKSCMQVAIPFGDPFVQQWPTNALLTWRYLKQL